MNKFKQGWVYAHNTAKDLDILIVKVRYSDENRSKLLIKWISKVTGDIRILPGGRMDGNDNIEVQAKDYQYWRRVNV
jgi:hypothetical protein